MTKINLKTVLIQLTMKLTVTMKALSSCHDTDDTGKDSETKMTTPKLENLNQQVIIKMSCEI